MLVLVLVLILVLISISISVSVSVSVGISTSICISIPYPNLFLFLLPPSTHTRALQKDELELGTDAQFTPAELLASAKFRISYSH